MSHRDAVDSLAAHLTRAGNRAYPELRRAGWQTATCGVPDVLAMRKFAYGATTWRLDAYEVKVNVGDLRSDVRAGKWHRYVSELGCRFVWFALATTETQALASEVPAECGVIVRAGDKWITKRTPRSLQHDLTKVDPMLLVAMMDNPPYRVEKESRSSRIRSLFAGKASDVVDGLTADELREIARKLGVRLRGALARPEPEAQCVNTWAEQLLTKWCELAGLDLEQTKSAIARGHFHDSLLVAVERGLRNTVQQARLQSLLSAAQQLSYGGDDKWVNGAVADAEDLAAEILALREEALTPRARRAKRKNSAA